jgi:hypothetical protein
VDVETTVEHLTTETVEVPAETLEKETGIDVHEDSPHFYIWAAIIFLYVIAAAHVYHRFMQSRPINPSNYSAEDEQRQFYTTKPWSPS